MIKENFSLKAFQMLIQNTWRGKSHIWGHCFLLPPNLIINLYMVGSLYRGESQILNYLTHTRYIFVTNSVVPGSELIICEYIGFVKEKYLFSLTDTSKLLPVCSVI